jgi:hypothetical protein
LRCRRVLHAIKPARRERGDQLIGVDGKQARILDKGLEVVAELELSFEIILRIFRAFCIGNAVGHETAKACFLEKGDRLPIPAESDR